MSKPILLDPERAAYLESLVTAGRYASTDEAVLEGLKLLQAREARLAELREAWQHGVESDGYEPVDAFLDDLTARCASRADADP